MAENNETPFSPLDPLGPEYGGINDPKLDELSYKPFEGDRINMPEINFSASPVPSFNSLNQPQLNVQNTITGIKPNKPGPQKGQSASDIASALNSYSKAISQANQDQNAYAKIYSYDAGPSGNNFYKRYAAFGQEKFDEIGFTPMRDNEALFNERTTKFDDFSRMMKHSFLPLLGQGFISGPKSLWKMAQGDFTSADLEDAKIYEEAAAIGQSTKGGAFGFVNNAAMNFGYTAGIISEIAAEELAAAGVTVLTEGGAAPLLAGVTERNIARLGIAVPRIAKYITKADDVFRGTVRALEASSTARAFYKAANSKVGRVLNPFSNTLEAMNTVRKAGEFDNITSLAKVSKTFGGFYADIRNVNAAVSESRLEAGMVENKVYQNLYDEYYKRNNEAPTNEQQYEMVKQSKQASLETLGWNTALIYASNKITFDNILNPKGGASRILGNKTKEILNLGTGKVFLKKTYEAGSKIAKGEFKYFENTIKGSLQRMKEMGFKESIKDVAAQTAKKSLTYFKGNLSEGLQENAQETIAQAMEKYHTDAFDSKAVKAHLYSKGASAMGMRDQGSYFAEAWKEQNPLTAKGFETFATGFVMGAFAAPMNALPGWASTGYNKIFKPEKYAEYKKAKTDYGKKVAQTLNDLYDNPKDFLDAKIFNLGNQEIMSKIKQTGGRKEALDAYDQTIVSQVYTALRTGTLNDFKEHLSSYKELTPEEFEGTMKGIPKGEGAKYQARIDDVLSRADEIQKAYNEVTERYPNPIDLDQYEEGTDAYKKAAIFQSAWENAKMNAIFMSEGYKNANKRINEIRNSILANKPLAKMTDSELQVLLQPERMSTEINLLRAEIDSQKNIISPEELKRKKNKLEALEELSEAFDYYQRYEVIDREKYVEEARASGNIKSIAKEFNISEEEVEEIIRQKIDSELKVKRKTSENTAEAESKLEAAYNKYLKSIATANGEVYLDENSEKTFEMLLDSYKLGDEAFTLASNINILRNPKDFMDNVERNYAWMQQLYDNRKKYFEGIVDKEITNVELNALLNALADRGYYISAEDLQEYMLNGIPPKEIYNDVTKETYKAGSEKYSEIYQEFFAKMDELRAEGKEKKSSVLDSEYQSQIDELMSKMQSELDALTKTEIKVEKGKILPKGKNKTISIKDVLEQIQPKEYVTLSIINKDGQTSFDETYYMNEDSELLYEDEDGEVVDTAKIKTRYTSGERYMYDLQADPVEVERITNLYNEQIEAVKQAYVEDKESIELEIPYEEVTQESNLDTPDLLDFRNDLYKQYQEEYVSSLSPEEQNALLEDDELNLETFENWYSQPENKKYFDEYNDKNRPKVSEIETVFTIRGVDVNTKTKTLKELINYRDSINDQITTYNEEIERLDDVTEKEFKKATQEIVKGLQLDVKNLNKVIAARQFANFPESIKQSIRSIQKVFKTQDKVERGVTLTEDDKVTGLRKGEKAYRINGKFHRRMTRAMHDVIEDEYSYQGQKDLDTIFDQTIGKKGLNPKSVSDFVSRLRVLSDSNEDALPGTNKLFFDALEDELKLLPSLTAAKIKLEKQKVNILEKAEKEKDAAKRDALYDKAVEIQNKIDGTTTSTTDAEIEDNFDIATKRNTTKDIINSFFAENSYEDSRVAGNFFDLAKDYLESGKKPEFNEKIITREAYDDLIAYLGTIKEKVDSGELYIVGTNLVVFDSDIQHPGGRRDRIAGEIDLIVADKDGIYVVDIKSGESKKFLNFNKLSVKKKAFSKRNEYTLQTGGYATMLERMIDRKIAGLAMLPVQRESNKQTNQVTAAGAPLKGSIYNELQYKKDADGNIIINKDIDPKTGKPFNEKQFEQTKNPYKFDFLVPLYRESVQEELDKLFSTREGKLQPGSKRELLLRYQQLRDSLNNITDEATKLNANRVIGLEKLIDKLINVDKIPIPKDIIDQLEEKKKLVKVYTGKEVLKSITKRYKEKLSNSDSIQKKQYDKLKNLKSDVSFDDIDKSMLEDDSDFINEQLEADKNFEYYYNEHDKYKNEDTKSATVNQQLAVQTMKASRLLTDEDIEDNLIDELSMADASDLIHEGVKRIQFLKTETTDQAANKFKDYQSNIFSLMTATKVNTNNLEFVELLDNAIFNAEQGFISEAYESISEKIGKLESELNRKYTKESRAEVITKEINDLNRFNEALAFAYQMPSDIFESVLGKEEEAELIVDEYSNEIKVGDIVYSKQNNNNTKYTVKSITSKNIILKDPKGKEISVEIGKFDEQYITESEMNAGNFTPPEYNPTEGEKSIIEQSQMSVYDFLRNADEDKAKAYQEGINNTPEENRKNLLNTTKDCQ